MTMADWLAGLALFLMALVVMGFIADFLGLDERYDARRRNRR